MRLEIKIYWRLLLINPPFYIHTHTYIDQNRLPQPKHLKTLLFFSLFSKLIQINQSNPTTKKATKLITLQQNDYTIN